MSTFDEWMKTSAYETGTRLSKILKQWERPKCDTCDDTGVTMDVVCYGGKPVEATIDCPDCTPKRK